MYNTYSIYICIYQKGALSAARFYTGIFYVFGFSQLNAVSFIAFLDACLSFCANERS